MGYVYQLLYDHPLIALALLAFAVWMAVDAYRRGVEPFWYYLILFVPLAGPLVYFFCHPASEWANWLGPLFQSRPGLAELEHRVQQSPTLANQLALGQELIARKSYEVAL